MLRLWNVFFLGVDLVQYGVARGCIDDTKWALKQVVYSADPCQVELSMRYGIGHPGLHPSFRAGCEKIVALHERVDDLTFLGGDDYMQNSADACQLVHDHIICTGTCDPGEFVHNIPSAIEWADQMAATSALVNLGELVLGALV